MERGSSGKVLDGSEFGFCREIVWDRCRLEGYSVILGLRTIVLDIVLSLRLIVIVVSICNFLSFSDYFISIWMNIYSLFLHSII